VSEESENEMMKQFIEEEFPFFYKEFNYNILNVMMKFCLNSSEIGLHSTINKKSRTASEKTFMYITTKDRDCFITS